MTTQAATGDDHPRRITAKAADCIVCLLAIPKTSLYLGIADGMSIARANTAPWTILES